MATKTWKIEKDLCRCCHAEGAFDNLAEPRIFLEKEEVYSNMLKECLDIDIPPVPGELCTITYTICNACIVRLRDACNFKKQVLDCEQRFMTLYYKNAIQGIKPETKVKEELDVTIEAAPYSDTEPDIVLKKEDEDDDDDHLMGGDDDDMSDDDIPIKQSLSVMKTRPKPKPKPKAPPVKKEKPPPKPKKKEEPKKKEPAKEKKGHESEAKRRNVFRLRPDDCKTEGDRLVCGHCDKSYDKLVSLRYHLKSKHYNIPKHVCPICDKQCLTTSAFTIHKLEAHNIDDRSHCNACKKSYNTKVQLRKHINNFHMLGERYQCPLCEYQSFSFEGMYKHKYKHKTEKDYQCSYCRKAFVRKTTLALHERIHTGDRRKVCQICGQAFVQKASLNYHMNKYHPGASY